MERILKALWRGDVCPAENIGKDRHYHQLHRTLCEAERKLTMLLSKDQLTALEEYEEIYTSLSDMENEIVFAKGFRLGVQLLLAALCEE